MTIKALQVNKMQTINPRWVTQEKIKQVLKYDRLTGNFEWVDGRHNAVKLGQEAGYRAGGYLSIQVFGASILAHRLAWLYVYGYLPESDIDHINQNKLDNRISNLREVSRICNCRNQTIPRNNKTGIKGVFYSAKTDRWRAKIVVNYEHHYLGEYDDFNDAVCARLAAEQCLDWLGCDSLSPAYKYVKRVLQCR